jgi:predicted methyltransferase MtxX (methanogen marker protein 4)
MSVDERKVSLASRRKSVADEPVTSVLAGGEVPDLGRELSADEEVLAALGYKYGSLPVV